MVFTYKILALRRKKPRKNRNFFRVYLFYSHNMCCDYEIDKRLRWMPRNLKYELGKHLPEAS